MSMVVLYVVVRLNTPTSAYSCGKSWRCLYVLVCLMNTVANLCSTSLGIGRGTWGATVALRASRCRAILRVWVQRGGVMRESPRAAREDARRLVRAVRPGPRGGPGGQRSAPRRRLQLTRGVGSRGAAPRARPRRGPVQETGRRAQRGASELGRRADALRESPRNMSRL